jgi:hypothetical protein
MKPYAENIQTFAAMYAGYAAAMDRFHEASKKHDATATFFPLFEALNWAVALDERAAKHWTPAGEPLSWEWREKVQDAEIMRGVRFIRNSVHHDWSDALELAEGRAYPKSYPVVYFEWRWRAADELPEPDKPDKHGEKVYRDLVEGKLVRDTLGVTGRVFLFLRQVLEPSSLGTASAPTVDMLITSDGPSDPIYGDD